MAGTRNTPAKATPAEPDTAPEETPTPNKEASEARDSDASAGVDDRAAAWAAERAELEAELAQLRGQAAAPKDAKELPPTHIQRLANGDLVETNAPVATHHSTEDGIFPVVATYLI